MDISLTTDENIRLSEIIQETEAAFDDPCSGSIESYDNNKIYLVFDFDDPDIDDHDVIVDRNTMDIIE